MPISELLKEILSTSHLTLSLAFGILAVMAVLMALKIIAQLIAKEEK